MYLHNGSSFQEYLRMLLAKSEITLLCSIGAWEHLELLRSTGKVNQSVWEVCMWLLDQFTFCWCCLDSEQTIVTSYYYCHPHLDFLLQIDLIPPTKWFLMNALLASILIFYSKCHQYYLQLQTSSIFYYNLQYQVRPIVASKCFIISSSSQYLLCCSLYQLPPPFAGNSLFNPMLSPVDTTLATYKYSSQPAE